MPVGHNNFVEQGTLHMPLPSIDGDTASAQDSDYLHHYSLCQLVGFRMNLEKVDSSHFALHDLCFKVNRAW